MNDPHTRRLVAFTFIVSVTAVALVILTGPLPQPYETLAIPIAFFLGFAATVSVARVLGGDEHE